VRPQGIVLEDHADVPLVRAERIDAASAEPDLAFVGLVEPGDQAEEGRLAAAGGAEQGEELTLLDLQGNPVDRGDLTEPLAERPEGDPQGFFQTASMSERNFVLSASERFWATPSS
jgi:hypothetical protein